MLVRDLPAGGDELHAVSLAGLFQPGVTVFRRPGVLPEKRIGQHKRGTDNDAPARGGFGRVHERRSGIAVAAAVEQQDLGEKMRKERVPFHGMEGVERRCMGRVRVVYGMDARAVNTSFHDVAGRISLSCWVAWR